MPGRAEPGNKSNDDRTAAKVKVEGARRIWNTWIHTTTKSVETAIAKFCGKIEGLRVKRKTRVSERSGKTLWWFVIHGEERKLCDLESLWERVSVHTSWEIRSCFMPAPDTQNNNMANTLIPATEPLAEAEPESELQKPEAPHAANGVTPTDVQAGTSEKEPDSAAASLNQDSSTNPPFLGHSSCQPQKT